jgi:hypothetical protein
VFPPDVDQRVPIAGFNHVFFKIVLLKVDEGRDFVPVFRQQIEGVDLFVTQEHAPQLPVDAFIHHPLAHAQTVPDFKRTLGIADSPRTDRNRVVVVQQNDLDPLRGKVQRGGQSDRPAANDHNGVANGLAGFLIL